VRRLAILFAVAAALCAAPGALAAGWCGTGETTADRPDVTTGQQVHAIVTVPSDGADTFAVDAGRVQDDVDTMTAWWTEQDPTRAPRFDQAVYPGGTCLDISFLRLPETASQLAGAGNAFRRITRDLELASFASQYKKYYVYYDGPSVETDICGTGLGEFALGPGFAIVWLQGCPDVQSVSVGTHELIHAFGALTDMTGAPHPCQGDPGHVCDSQLDVLYPVADPNRTFAQQVLDVGHDDYYAHSGAWPDLQDSVWLRHLELPPVSLTVTMAGGSGTITSDVPGIACGAPCTTQWDPASLVTLHAAPATGFRFVRWTGACTGNGNCAVVMAQAQTATAVFGPSRVALRVTKAGRGAVRCTPACTTTFPAGKVLTLRAVAANGWRFVAWSGGCRGSRPVCRPATGSTISVRATFRKQPAKPKR
jgi:Divergent InlB B-repeat domain